MANPPCTTSFAELRALSNSRINSAVGFDRMSGPATAGLASGPGADSLADVRNDSRRGRGRQVRQVLRADEHVPLPSRRRRGRSEVGNERVRRRAEREDRVDAETDAEAVFRTRRAPRDAGPACAAWSQPGRAKP